MVQGNRDDALREMNDAWRAHLTRAHHITFAPPDDVRRYAIAAGSQILRWFGLKTGDFQHMLEDVSFTLPTIPGLWDNPVVLRSKRSAENPLDDLETTTHEATHGRDLRELYKDAGPLPAEVNYGWLYAAEKDARARCEGKAYVAGFYARMRVSGKRFAQGDASGRMHRIYMLDGEGDLDMVDDHSRSDLASIHATGLPPHFMAVEFGGWIDDAFPELTRPLEAAGAPRASSGRRRGSTCARR